MIKIKNHYWNPLTMIKNLFYVTIGLFELYLFVEYIKIVFTNI